MYKYGTRRKDEGCSLSELVALLRDSCAAVTRLQGGHTYYEEELAIFREAAQNEGLFLSEAPEALSRPPSDEGNEHQVWFLEHSALYLKASWPNHFGLKVIHSHDEEPAASPIDYLERWLWHNQLFGDSVRFIGALDTFEGLRLIIEQPAIKGHPASGEEINTFFTSNGWKKFTINSEVAYYDAANQAVISDTHRGNIVATMDGLLLPIDLRGQTIEGSLLDTVRNLTQ